jgi:hypothetical protein
LNNARLTEDRITATKMKRDKGFSNLVINTWDKVIREKEDVPKDWLIHSEVLVGSGTLASRARRSEAFLTKQRQTEFRNGVGKRRPQ